MNDAGQKSVLHQLRTQVALAQSDPEFSASASGLACSLALGITIPDRLQHVHEVQVLAGEPGGGRLLINARAAVWQNIMSAQPDAGLHSVTAGVRSGAINVVGEAVHAAQALHTLERLFEILRGQVREDADTGTGPLALQSIHGSYAALAMPNGERIQVYVEKSGCADAPIILMLHTAGADSRQFHALMANEAMKRDWHMVAFDMPGHGRSMPRQGQAWRPYVLNKADYLAICRAIVEQYLNKAVVAMGCSMGAAMALKLATDAPQDVLAAVALEAPWKAKGRRSPMLSHARVNQSAHNAAYIRGLMSPTSPLAHRRDAAWIYGQGGFQIYGGDLAFYSDDFDAEIDLEGLDGTKKVISLLTGAYDYSASPDDTGKVAAMIPGAKLTIMEDLGHFPMTENPERLLDYLQPELAAIRERIAPHA